MRLNAVSTCRLALTLAALLALPAAPLQAEKMVVANAGGGTGDRGVLLVLDTETGLRTQLSDFGDPALGVVGMNMRRIAEDAAGDLVVVDPFVSLLFRVDGDTGQRTVVSDFSTSGQGPTALFPAGVALDSQGRILVTDANGDSVFRVDPATGQRTVLSDFSNPGQGPGVAPLDVAIDGAGRILVSDSDGAKVLIVDPTTGNRTILSDFGNPAQGELADVSGVAADPVAGIFVVDGITDRIYKVDAATGNRTRIADFNDPDHGTVWDFRPTTLAVDSQGMLQVVGSSVVFGGFDSVITVDPVTGDREMLSELSWNQQGAIGFAPTGITAFRRQVFADGFESGNVAAWSSSVGF
jgi:outer membrane protein assembly factor BamB